MFLVEVEKRIFVGNDVECFTKKAGWVIVHACKFPCHVKAVACGNVIPKDHPHYLVKADEDNLFLNMIDPAGPLFKQEIFSAFFNFTIPHYENSKNIFIHCNRGESRAPSLALLFMSKYLGAIGNLSFENAKNDFLKVYKLYSPGMGIVKYLSDNWQIIF